MAQAKVGDTVKVHYTGKLEDGTVFDTSCDQEPLKFTIGSGKLIPGFEEAVVGMKPGESKTTEISADKAYGPYREEMVILVDRDKLPDNLEPKVGEQLQIRQANDQSLVVRVIDVTELQITLDANHPLAGKDLTFEIRLIEVA
ncbi:MAG: peptidylprolyl isomerase [Candidatus Glassbacteria bacterium]